MNLNEQTSVSLYTKAYSKYEKLIYDVKAPHYLNRVFFLFLEREFSPTFIPKLHRVMQCSTPEFWKYMLNHCTEGGGGQMEMTGLVIFLTLAGEIDATRTLADKRKQNEKIERAIRELLLAIKGDPLSELLTLPILAKTQSTKNLESFFDTLKLADSGKGLIQIPEKPEKVDKKSNSERVLAALEQGPHFIDILDAALSIYSMDVEASTSSLGLFDKSVSKPYHPKALTDRRVFLYLQIIIWLQRLNHNNNRLDQNLISKVLDSILMDEDPSLVGHGDAWKNALRRAKNFQMKKK